MKRAQKAPALLCFAAGLLAASFLPSPAAAAQQAQSPSQQTIASPAASRQGPRIGSSTMFGAQQRRLESLVATHTSASLRALMASQPPEFCAAIPAITATMLTPNEPGKDLWNFDQLPLARKIAFERTYTALEGKVRDCLGQAIQRKDEKTIEVTVLAWSLLEARHLDLRASLLQDAIAQMNRLSGAVEAMQKLVLAENRRLAEARGQRTSDIGRQLASWVRYEQQLALYRRIRAIYAYQPQAALPRTRSLDLLDMVRNAQEDIRNASQGPLGPQVNCTTIPSIDGTTHTVCR